MQLQHPIADEPAAPAYQPLEGAVFTRLIPCPSEVLVLADAIEMDTRWRPESVAVDYWVVDILQRTEGPGIPKALALAAQWSNGLRHPAQELSPGLARIRCFDEPQARLLAGQIIHNLTQQDVISHFKVTVHSSGGSRHALRDGARVLGVGDAVTTPNVLGLEVPEGYGVLAEGLPDANGKVSTLVLRIVPLGG